MLLWRKHMEEVLVVLFVLVVVVVLVLLVVLMVVVVLLRVVVVVLLRVAWVRRPVSLFLFTLLLICVRRLMEILLATVTVTVATFSPVVVLHRTCIVTHIHGRDGGRNADSVVVPVVTIALGRLLLILLLLILLWILLLLLLRRRRLLCSCVCRCTIHGSCFGSGRCNVATLCSRCWLLVLVLVLVRWSRGGVAFVVAFIVDYVLWLGGRRGLVGSIRGFPKWVLFLHVLLLRWCYDLHRLRLVF